MKLEIGGSGALGDKARGDGWVNIDKHWNADIKWDLSRIPWCQKQPDTDADYSAIPADSVDEVYSSHTIEHVPEPMAFLNEIARIGKIGCPVEIRCPHPASQLAMTWDHKHVFAPIGAINAEAHFPKENWPNPKRLKLLRIEYGATFLLEEAKRDLPFLKGIPDELILKYGLAGAVHDCRFFYQVVENEFYERDNG